MKQQFCHYCLLPKKMYMIEDTTQQYPMYGNRKCVNFKNKRELINRPLIILQTIGGDYLVNKLTSLHPDKYKTINITHALKDYGDYVYRAGYTREEKPYKTFAQWLDTEI